MTPVDRYRLALQRGELQADPAQAAFVGRLQDLHRRLMLREEAPAASPGLLRRMTALFASPAPAAPPRGIYVWGSVGRGKTLLVDFFFDSLPFAGKWRIHFHDFMEHVHADLKALGNRRDPLSAVADGMAERTGVLCFDEFHVSDIADAMLLGRLMEALFERGIALVATSNSRPDELYRDGLQRERFMPAITLIERHTEVIHLDSATDYRLRALERDAVYHSPLDDEARAHMARCYAELAPDAPAQPGEIEVHGRWIPVKAMAHGCAWFEFGDLCEAPRSAGDYLELARRFHTVLVSSVPLLDDERNDAALRFMHLVDTLYDRNVNLVASAEAAPDRLYLGSRLGERFQRTRSRLEEMQSHDYLARAHLP
jgi:cell division protein ZapE